MNRDLQELPRFDDKWSFLYLEKGHIEQDVQTVAYMYADKKVPIPIETLSVLMLGPGTTITQAAIRLLAEARCLICWVGEDGVRMYSAGTVGTYSARNLLRQAQLFNDPDARLVVVRRLYSMRFKEPIDTRLSIEQLRGKEGARVRTAYKEAAEEYGIEWTGRNYDQSQWGISDPVNKALSAANSCLYGLCHAAILAVGCSPGIGFIHTGKQLSFVYDIADLYKTEFTIPIAFRVAQAPASVASRARQECRDTFKERRLIKRIIPDLMEVLYGDRSLGKGDAESEGRDVAVNY